MELHSATRHLYEVFQPYTIAGNLRERSCPCCVTDEEIRILLSKDLRELSEEEIGHFMRSAVTTYGDVEDYKHFLPRVLELMQFPESTILDDFTIFDKLNYTKWETWKEEEINAIDNYFLALWRYIITNEDVSHYQIESILEIVSKYTGLEKALLIWENTGSKKSTSYIVEYILYGHCLNLKEVNQKLLMNWISQKQTLQKVENLFFETTDKEEANRISIAYTILENFNNSNYETLL